jgi:CHASE2 domain-containing sensor protein
MTRAQQIGVIMGLLLVAALTALRMGDPQSLKFAREATFDEYQRLAPRAFERMPVRVIDIDEASLQEFGQWPWPRDRMAALVNRLSEMGASAIAFDILFAEPDRLSPRNVVRDLPIPHSHPVMLLRVCKSLRRSFGCDERLGTTSQITIVINPTALGHPHPESTHPG